MDSSFYSSRSADSSRRSKESSKISKIYKEASSQYLTRRLSESLATLQTLLIVSASEEDEAYSTEQRPLISDASRKSRIKVWSLYISLLNAIAELGPVEGSEAFGIRDWKRLVEKARDGSVWTEVVNVGYGGEEARVDAEVVANLANLLLAQAEDQTLNQQYLEAYLSSSSQIDAHKSEPAGAESITNGGAENQNIEQGGHDMLRQIELRMQLVEIYALHVLPRNGEWTYAREFIEMCDILGEERKEGFLQILKSMEEDVFDTKPLKHIEPMQEPEKIMDTPAGHNESTDSLRTVRERSPSVIRKSPNHQDYGIDDFKLTDKSQTNTAAVSNPKLIRQESSRLQPRLSKSSPRAAPQRPKQTHVYQRSVALFSAIQNIVSNMSVHLSHNPLALLRFLLFLVGIITAFTRRDVKERLGSGWEKLKRTVGMGVNISYM